MELKFKATIRRSGNSNIITIPSDFIEHQYLEFGKKYWFEVDNKKKGDTNESNTHAEGKAKPSDWEATWDSYDG